MELRGTIGLLLLSGALAGAALAELEASNATASEREQSDELAVALSSDDMMDRILGIKTLSAMINSGEGLESSDIRALLQALRADPDPNVAFQAEVELARMDGIDLIPAEVRSAHRLSMEREQVDECEAALGSTEMMERMLAVKSLAAIADDAIEPVRVVSLLRAARSDPDWNVSEQARVALEAWSARWED